MVYVPDWLVVVVGLTEYIPVDAPIVLKFTGSGPDAVTDQPELVYPQAGDNQTSS